ncbi:MAG: ABC transporter ATP-binding protein [Alphaproteobacteria bacterium]|nr:ABC transporter ATP-binding protein [Alphaproteobacteria bacterium]
MSAILDVQALVAGYEPGLPIVRGASIRVGRGELVVVLGPNGAGKSTLIKAIAGLVAIENGAVLLEGRPITHLPAHRMIGAGIGFVPQTDNVFQTMTVEEQLRLVAASLPRRARKSALDAAFALFPDLARYRAARNGALSGGQRQMVAIASALLPQPKVLLLDEPSAGLSPKMVEAVLAKLGDIRRRGVAIVLVEQNVRAALAVADRAYVMVEGVERHEGTAASLLDDPVVARLYLGRKGDAA